MSTKTETIEAQNDLRAILERNHTVYAIVKHVSRSGMQRRIEFYVIEGGERYQLNPDVPEEGSDVSIPRPRRISHLVAKVRGSRLTDDGVVVNGCGMDMGWDTIYSCRFTLGLGDVRYVDSAVGEQFKLGYGFDLRYL